MFNRKWNKGILARRLVGVCTNLVFSLLVPVTLVFAWHYVTQKKIIPASLLPSPQAVGKAFWAMLSDKTLFVHTIISSKRLGLGFAIGAGAGIITGTMVGYNRWVARLLEPTIASFAPVPPVAWVPLLIVLLGIGEESKVALVALGTFFIVSINAAQGIRSSEHLYVEMARAFNKKEWILFWFVLWPSALPQIFLGMRVALGLSWTLLLLSEIIASSQGLGWLIWDARNFSRVDEMYVGIIVVGLLGRITDLLLFALARFVTRWRSTYGS